MEKFNTIHVFGYGETQIITNDSNSKFEHASLTKQKAFIDSLKSKRPTEVQDMALHCINIHAGNRVDYVSKEKGGNFSVKVSDLDTKKFNAFVNELISLIPVAAPEAGETVEPIVEPIVEPTVETTTETITESPVEPAPDAGHETVTL